MNSIIELIKNNENQIRNIQFDTRSEAMNKLADILKADKTEVLVNVNKTKEIYFNNHFIDIETKTIRGIKKIIKIRVSNGKSGKENIMGIIKFNDNLEISVI